MAVNVLKDTEDLKYWWYKI